MERTEVTIEEQKSVILTGTEEEVALIVSCLSSLVSELSIEICESDNPELQTRDEIERAEALKHDIEVWTIESLGLDK